MDTSDSESERYGARYSPEASPQDDKVANGVARHNADSTGYKYDRVGVRFNTVILVTIIHLNLSQARR